MGEPFNDLKQVELSIEAAQKMVGSATMSMEPGQLQAATDAINAARGQLQNALNNATGVDNEFLNEQESLLQDCEEQLKEAKR
ncbi:Protein of unknown function (DUF2564) [Schinkia azotoformans MEV2011]|uniref:Cytosolic protein n=2 Tax=Schinkia azotoformans TaxID=1454 RepID=K6CU18_SCHAZ|nr:DUF2564 family protein [Schinkia azotoformans]EKN63737.1 hypothetical protein BAZO_16079 [Schinkia azotoformans LMG 9581]KEF37090.1 Protein of unknown function (DUF2564) [Schinkia azotoformans MEV2011]MEC1640950.1 DUF2564 family protein [Schinkia azotoformans]MEC1694315.1 DUF2564 family protein [Schinkia azotoformans]MEC1718030.1 DUF2564 family protein [Schinkia azotoformans]